MTYSQEWEDGAGKWGIVAYPLRRFAPRHPCLRGTKKNGKRKTENGNLRVSESMVGTRHAVSDNNSKSGLGMPSPYIPDREQGKRKTER